MRATSISTAFLILPIAMVWMLLMPSTVTPSQPPLAPHPIRVAPPEDRKVLSEPIDAQDSDGTVDLYGNEVSDSVAKYRLDTAGSVYELHSPHTELPRLGSPKT